MSLLRAARFPALITACLVAYAIFAAYGALAQPVAQFKRPAEGVVVSDQIYIEVAFDSRSTQPVTRMVLCVDDRPAFTYTLKEPQGYGRQVFRWNTKQLASGPHILMAKVYDALGRPCVNPPRVRVYVDNGAGGPGPDVPTPTEQDQIPPTVRLSSPANGATVSGKIEIGVEATDDSGVKFVFVYIDDQFKSMTNRQPFRFVQDTTKLEDGLHTITATAVDPFENRGESAKVYVRVENPRYATTAPAGPPSGRVPMSPRPGVTPTTGVETAWLPPSVPTVPEASTTGAPDREPLSSPSLACLAMLPGVPGSVTYAVRADRPKAEAVSFVATIGPALTSAATVHLPPMTSPAGAVGPERALAANVRATPPTAVRPGVVSAPPAQTKSAPNGRPVRVAAAPTVSVRPGLGPAGATAPTTATGSHTLPPLTSPSEPRVYALPSPNAVLARLPTIVVSHGPRASRPVPPSPTEATVTPQAPAPATAAAATDKATAYAALPRTSTAAAPARNALPATQPRSSKPGARPIEHIVHLGGKQFKVVFDDAELALRTSPKAPHGVPMGPIREIFEHAGGQVHWYPVEKRVSAITDKTQVELKIGNRSAKLNHERVLLRLAPFISNGRTMVPFSFLEQALNVTVLYDPAADRILITSNAF